MNHDALALAAVRAVPALARQVEPQLGAAEQTLAAWAALPEPEDAALATVRAAIAAAGSGAVRGDTLQIRGGAALFARLAAAERWPVWLDGGAAGQRLVCAQLIAAYGLHPALIPPQAGPDPAPLESLLAAAAAAHGPLALLVWQAEPAADPVRPALPRALPPGVTLVCWDGGASGADLDPAAAPLPDLPLTRRWVLAQERRTGSHAEAALTAAHALEALRTSAEPGALSHAALLAATLRTLARTLPPDATAAAFVAAVASGEPREAALRAVRALVDQLPDGPQKAAVLRRLGEACHERGMRGAAMRLLAAALDLEAAGTPRAWREAREEAQAALARAALAHAAPEIALSVTVRINHAERRGFIETEVVRHYISTRRLRRAEEVALAIGHDGMHEWAMAEVGVAHAASGNRARAETVIGTLRTATAAGWALATIISADARRGLPDVDARVATIAQPRLRDAASAALAAGRLARGDLTGALAACAQIADTEARVQTLVDLAATPAPGPSRTRRAAASDFSRQALGQAEALLPTLDEHRLPLVVALTGARAAVSDLAGVQRVADTLPPGEERDRALARAAVALAQHGNTLAAQRLASSIPDTDERDRAYREIIGRLSETTLAALGWQAAAQIVDPLERALALADASLALAQRGASRTALQLAGWIADQRIRTRTELALIGALLAHGELDAAVDLAAKDYSIAEWDRRSLALVAGIATNLDTALADSVQTPSATLRDALRLAVERTAQIGAPLLRARALLALARACASAAPDQARAWLGAALQEAAALGRPETMALIVQAADLLVLLGGPETLLTAAHALDEIDGWFWGPG